MRTIPFFPWTKPASVLGYGTTSFMSAGSTQERLALLECALDAGITHFDTAAYYGYGEAERLLGRILEGRRDQVTITTKFGMEPSAVVKSRWVNLAARKVLAMVPALRKWAGKARGALSAQGIFEPGKAKASLERSLEALKTDYIDLFLLHEPTPGDAASPAVIDFLEGEVARGRIRAYGCGGEWPQIQAVAAQGLPTGRWLQFEDNAINRRIEEPHLTGAHCITFAPFNKALQVLSSRIASQPAMANGWSSELDLDCRDKTILASLLLASCHVRNREGIVLFSSKTPGRIQEAARIADGRVFTSAQMEKFLELTTAFAGGKETTGNHNSHHQAS